jgi:hypothetical protein
MSDTESTQVAVLSTRDKIELGFAGVVSMVGVYVGTIYEVGAPWLWATDACQDPATVCGIMPIGPFLVVLTVVLSVWVAKR